MTHPTHWFVTCANDGTRQPVTDDSTQVTCRTCITRLADQTAAVLNGPPVCDTCPGTWHQPPLHPMVLRGASWWCSYCGTYPGS